MTPETEIAMWRQITGLNVTDVRHVPRTYPGVQTTIDGQHLTNSGRVELQIDGEWPAPNGVYTVNAPTELENP